MVTEKVKRLLQGCFALISKGINSDAEHVRNEAEQAMRTAKALCLKYGLDYDKQYKEQTNGPDDAPLGFGTLAYDARISDVMDWEPFQTFCVAVSKIVSCRVVFSTSGKYAAICGNAADYELFMFTFEYFLSNMNLFYQYSKAIEVLAYSMGFSHGLYEYSMKPADDPKGETTGQSMPSDLAIVLTSNKLARLDKFINGLGTTSKPIDEREQAEAGINKTSDLLSLMEGLKDGRNPKTRMNKGA